MTETNQNLFKITSTEEKVADNQNYEVADEKELDAISKKLIEQNIEAYKKLAEWVKKDENPIIPFRKNEKNLKIWNEN